MRHPDEIRIRSVEENGMRYELAELRFGRKAMNFVHTNRLSAKRYQTLMHKEPMTIAWLDTFAPEDVYFDIGANIGMYAIYAARMTGCRVYGFEPESLNYAELNKNIHFNGLRERITAYCVAVSDQLWADVLHLSQFVPGFSHHDFQERRWQGPVIKLVESAAARPAQGCLGMPVDFLVEQLQLPCPQHIKIDVDGLESRVIKGLQGTLARPQVRSVLIETDYSIPESVDLIAAMTAQGWQYSLDQVCTDRYGTITPAEWQQRVRKGEGGNNIVYFRDPAYADIFAKAARAWPGEEAFLKQRARK